MYTNLFRSVCIVFGFSYVGTLAAQSPEKYRLPPVEYQPVPTWPSSFGESYHHDSTAAGNYLRGLASVIHASGNYWLNRSQAEVLCEYARSLQLDNHEHWISFYRSNLRRLNAERQAEKAATHAKNVARRPTIYRTSYELTDIQLDRRTGEIDWPVVLRTANYAEARSRIESLFRQSASGLVLSKEEVDRLSFYVEGIRNELRRDLKSVDRSDYNRAHKFLCGLEYEPEFSATKLTVSDSSNERLAMARK